MSDLVDFVEMQGWSHLFEWPVLVLYEKEVELYYNLRLNDDGSIDTVMMDKESF